MNTKTIAVSTLAMIGLLSSLNSAVCAPTASTDSNSGAALTIYNENFAVVRDTIPLDLKAGTNQITYTGITSKLEPDSVILNDPTGRRTLSILEQNYRGDTVNQGMLLALNEGKTIDFQVPGVNGAPPTIIEGTIIRSGYRPTDINNNPYYYNQYVNQNQFDSTPLVDVDGKLQFSLPGTPLFPSLADDSILKPTLDWSIYSDKAGAFDAELAYITDGITWESAYNVVAPETGSDLDLTAWVTIKNESGKEFDNAHIKLMAGDVNKVQPNNGGYSNFSIGGPAMAKSINGLATEQALDEYHLYTLPNPTSLQNNETKQVEFLHAGKVASQELYIYDGLQMDPNQYNGWNYSNIRNTTEYGTQSNKKITIERDFVNSQANGLGVPLPAGKVRFYRRDSDGQLEFVGENTIDHTPKDETVKIVTGNAFDVVGSRTQINYSIDNAHDTAEESFSIALTNHKSTPIDITVVEHLYRAETWTIADSSDPYVKKDSNTINFLVNVPAGATKTVTYRVHYTW